MEKKYMDMNDDELFSMYSHYLDQVNLIMDEVVKRVIAEPSFDDKFGAFQKLEEKMRGLKQ